MAGDTPAQPTGNDKDASKDSNKDSASGSDLPDCTPADDSKKAKHSKKDKDNPCPAGTEPVKGDVAANVKVDPEKVVDVGGEMEKVKPGSIDDVNAVGNREIGGRGLGNWYSTDSEIKMGKMYAD